MKIHPMVLALLLLAPMSLTASAADMPAGGFAGTWKANFTKSKFPGKPPLVDMCTVDSDGTVTVNETNSEGKSSSWHYKPVAGEAVPVIGRDNTTVLVKKVNDHTNEQTWNSNGRASKSQAVLSQDGKVTTFTMDGTDKEGKPFHELVVYDKEDKE
jgi:hypothetical protein